MRSSFIKTVSTLARYTSLAGIATLIAASSFNSAIAQDYGFSQLPGGQNDLRAAGSQSTAKILMGENQLRPQPRVPEIPSTFIPSTQPKQEFEFSAVPVPAFSPGNNKASIKQTSHAAATTDPASAPAARTAAQPANPSRRATANPTRTVAQPIARNYSLQSCDWQQFEANLLGMWMSNPQVQPLQEGRVMRVSIPLRDNSSPEATMLIDRQESTLYFEGNEEKIQGWREVVQLLDRGAASPSGVQMISTVGMSEPQFRTVSHLISTQQQQQQQGETVDAIQLPPTTQDDEGGGGPVNARVLSDLDLLILTGDKADVEKLKARINKFLEDSRKAQAINRTIPLQSSADPTEAATVIQEIYDAQYLANQGAANITPIQNPKGLLVTGKTSAIEKIENIVQAYDKQADELPPAKADFKSYRLKHMSVVDAKQRIDEFFNQSLNQGIQTPGNAEPVLTIADFRSNVLIVKAAPNFLQQVDLLVEELDVADSEATSEIRIIPLKNTEATVIAPLLQFALNGTSQNAPQSFSNSTNAGGQVQAPQPVQTQAAPTASNQASRALQLMTLDRQGNEVRSGILFEVNVSADQGSNSLIISGPAESMALIEALVERLDVLPQVETQIKVFQILNGDASALIEMLNTLFTDVNANAAGGGGTASALPLQSATARDGQSLGGLRLTLDERTNSIIASGPVGTLEVIRSLLIRLDEEDINRRQVTVYRLNNAFAVDVADAVNEWLNERTTLVSDNFNSPFVANQREVIVVPETQTNSLILSALPKYFEEVIEVIDRLDRRPPMVKVKVLLAEVSLNALEEFGTEVGIQDALVFGRGQSVADTIVQNVVATGENLAASARANFGTGTFNPELGFGGLVLSAGNESINLVLRALKDRNCLRILSKPQLMTIENLQGRVAIVQNVPRITGSTITNFGVQNNITEINVGVTLEVTPRVSPDGMIVMFVNAINSTLAADGVVVATDANGIPIESPIVNETQAQTTVMARSGQTVVISGLIQETKSNTRSGAPILSDLPVIGPLFGFQSESAARTELLIIMTPYIVDGDETLRQQNEEELDRMHWCLCDVAELYGGMSFDGNDTFSAPTTIYPDSDPAGVNPVQTEYYQQQNGFNQIPNQLPGEVQAPIQSVPSSGSSTR